MLVIRIPGRAFPGILIQGDSLNSLYSLALDIQNLVNTDPNSEELVDLTTELVTLLSDRLKLYEDVLKENNLELPYIKR